MKKVLILFGGNSSEHYISCLSTASILKNIDTSKFEVDSIGIDFDNRWYRFDDDLSYLEEGNWLNVSYENEITNIVEFIRCYDVIFPMIHGRCGEDGKIQGFLELFDIPYVGSDSLSSGIGMDKEMSKIIFDSVDIPQVPYLCFKHKVDYRRIFDTFDFPMIVKPANGGSSIGINKANNKKELKKSIKEAFKYDCKVIVEPFIKARELECAVFEDKRIIVSSVGEVVSANEFYDYNAKYENDKSKTIIPASIPVRVGLLIQKYAMDAFTRIGASGLSRIDFFYDEVNDMVYLNEINTLPGFTNISMYPKLVMSLGYTYSDIITKLILSALK